MKLIIRAVPDRILFVKEILKEVPEAEVCWDQTKNATNTALSALEMAGEDSTIQFEDDVELTSNFLEKATTVIEMVKNSYGDIPIQFFSMRKADLEVGSRLEPGRNYMMAQCTYLPEGMASDVVKWKRTTDTGDKDPDTMLAQYFKENGIKYWISVPSLVQHKEIKSAIDPRRSSRRQSKTYEP